MSSICSPISHQRLVVSEKKVNRSAVSLFLIPSGIWAINFFVVFFALPFLLYGWLRR